MKTRMLPILTLVLGLVEISLGGWETSGDNIFTEKGNVGIGTTTPGYGLDVEKATGWTTARFGSKVPIYMMSNGNPTIGFNARCVSDGWKFGEGNTDPNYGGIIGLDPIEGTLFLGVTNNKGKSDESPSFAAGMYVTKESKVGIGTTSPGTPLHVSSTTPTEIRLEDIGSRGHLDLTYYFDGIHRIGFTDGSTTGEGNWLLRVNWPDGTTWLAPGGGNVGIGTSNPTGKLEVQGGPIKATGGLIIETRTSDPPDPVTGQMWLITDP